METKYHIKIEMNKCFIGVIQIRIDKEVKKFGIIIDIQNNNGIRYLKEILLI